MAGSWFQGMRRRMSRSLSEESEPVEDTTNKSDSQDVQQVERPSTTQEVYDAPETSEASEVSAEPPAHRYHTRSQDGAYGKPPAIEQQEFYDEQYSKESPSPMTASQKKTQEWDASRTPPSRFQKRKGSLLATRASRFGGGRLPRSTSKERDREYFQKIQEKGWA